jgi:Protein of unknown function (DUF3047)
MSIVAYHGGRLLALMTGLLVACAAPAPPLDGAVTGAELPLASEPEVAAAPERDWHPYTLPGKRETVYRFTRKDGRRVIEARADGSASMLRRKLDMPAESLAELSWSWWVDAPLADADLADADRTDAPASVMLAFDGDKARLPARARLMFDLARALTGEEPPYATLVYTWSTQAPPETVVRNPRSDRIRKIVVDSGSSQAKQWREHRRNVVADYQKAFGEPPGRLIGVAVFTDADNTRSKARAWYGPINFHPPAGYQPVRAVKPCVASVGKSCSSANN